jgi:hypothetical protein
VNCEQVIRDYLSKIKAEFACEESDGRLRIVTPYLYPDNDLVEVYVEELRDGRVRVSDLGEATRHLHTQGFDVFASPKRKFIAETAASRVNAVFENGVIVKEGSPEEIGGVLFDVIAAARGVADLVYTSRAYEPAPFVDEVADFLTEHQFRFERRVPIRGESGREYRVGFRIEQKILLHPISAEFQRALKPRVDAALHMWLDVDRRASKFTLLNDVDFSWPEPDVVILSRFSSVFRWSAREQIVDAIRKAG